MAAAMDPEPEQLPQQGEILSVAAMVSDAAHFLKQRLKRPKQGGRWGATAIAEDVSGETILPKVEAPVARKGGKGKVKTAKAHRVPPSVKRAYEPMRSADVYTDEAPVFAPDAEYQVGVVGDAWRRLIDNVAISTLTTDRSEKKVQLSVPPSFVEHEQEQLRIGRKSKSTGALLQACSFKDQCAAFCLTGNNKALHPYLTASQQEAWDRDGVQTSGPCLLCVRRTVTSVAMLYKRDSIAVNPHSKLPCLVPFYNTIDEPGGYRREFCIMPSDVIFLPGPMCAYNTGALRFVPTATDASGVLEGFVDQCTAVYNTVSSN